MIATLTRWLRRKAWPRFAPEDFPHEERRQAFLRSLAVHMHNAGPRSALAE